MSTREQLQAASLQGIAARWIVGNGDCAPYARAVRDLLDAGDDGTTMPLSYAVAEIRQVGASRDTLSRAAARFTDDDELEPHNRWILALLVLAGADEGEARQLRAERNRRPTWDPGTWQT